MKNWVIRELRVRISADIQEEILLQSCLEVSDIWVKFESNLTIDYLDFD